MCVLVWYSTASAAGPFGPPQPLAREGSGLHTAIGYWSAENRFGNGSDYTLTQNQVYSEAGYGAPDRWEIYGRIGIADLNIADAYRPAAAGITASRNDFEDNWSFFGTLGGKVYQPVGKSFGAGAFFQFSYTLSDYSDTVSGTFNGTPFTADVTVENPWDVNVGIGFQALVFSDIQLYAGPYFRYAEDKVSSSATVAGIRLIAGDVILRNKTSVGGFAGIDLPLYKMFHLNLEAQYSDRLSAGAAVSFIY